MTAQGLFMYFEEAEALALLHAICDRFPGVEIMFDTIPRWFSNLPPTIVHLRTSKHAC